MARIAFMNATGLQRLDVDTVGQVLFAQVISHLLMEFETTLAATAADRAAVEGPEHAGLSGRTVVMHPFAGVRDWYPRRQFDVEGDHGRQRVHPVVPRDHRGKLRQELLAFRRQREAE